MNVSSEMSVASLAGSVVPEMGKAIPEIQAVYLFGSAAEGRLRADSDVDLAVLAAAPVEREILFDTAGACARLLGREVDLVDLRAASLPLQAQIVGRGRRLAVPGARAAAFFENQVLSRYGAFAEERRPVVAEIVRRRAIHAA